MLKSAEGQRASGMSGQLSSIIFLADDYSVVVKDFADSGSRGSSVPQGPEIEECRVP